MIAEGERDAYGAWRLVYNWARKLRLDPNGPARLDFTCGDPDDYTLTCTVVLGDGNKLFVRLDADYPDEEVIGDLDRQWATGGFK